MKFIYFRFQAIFELNSIGVNIGTFFPFATGSLNRSEKLFFHFSIIPYRLKIVLSLKYGRKKYLLVSIRSQDLNPVEYTLMEAPKSLCEKPLFLSIFFNKSIRNAQVL